MNSDVFRKVRQIEILSKSLVNSTFAGEYHSVFKGQGMEFAEVREYLPGDDIRSIDWNVTARTGLPHVKKHVEERELLVMLVVDASASTIFGTRGQTKQELATELCAVLAFSAIQNNDKVGLITFTDHVEKFVPPRKGRKHVLRVVRELLSFSPQKANTDIATALEYLSRVLRRRAVVFLVSDFRSAAYEDALKLASRRHDLIALHMHDHSEMALPDVGILELEDSETGHRVLLDTSEPQVREAYAALAERDFESQQQLLRALQIDTIPISTGEPYIEPLIRFFRLRAQRMSHA